MKRISLLLLLILVSIFSTFPSNQLIQGIKERIFDICRNPFFQNQEQHELATNISNKGNTTDLSLRELYWNTYQPESELDSMISTQQTDGSWKDIDYNDLALSNWQPTNHISRLLFLGRVYITPGSKFYQNKEVSVVLHRGINYWFKVKPVCKNWWYNEIAVPRFMGLVFIFMENELNPIEKTEAIKVMNHSGFRMTGQNKVWLAGNVLLKALITNDEILAKEARDTIASEIFITSKEGIQPDYSFHQHGPQQQFGNYGLAYISSMAYYANVFGGTSLAFSQKEIDILRNYVFDGENWIVWRGFMDVSACNRQLFKQAQVGKALTLCVAVDQLKKSDLLNSKAYNDFLTRNLQPGILKENNSAKHFWCSDLTVFRADNHYISIRACSPRVKGTEFTNNENKKGHFISDGCTIIMRRGDEYEDIFPVWDWNRLPGVTAPVIDNIKPQTKTDDYHNPNPFVGGLTFKSNGISTFHLSRNGVDAKKSWFYIHGLLVCLGSDIQTKVNKEIVTGINQVKQQGDVLVTLTNGKSLVVNDTLENYSTVKSIWHDSIGYLFLKQQNIRVSTKIQFGNWHDIADPYSSEEISGKVFKLWISHGENAVSNPTYEYIIIPSVSQDSLNRFTQNQPIEIIENSKTLQAVKLKDNTLFQLVFFKPVRITTFSNNEYLETKTPGLLMLERKVSNDLILTVADPTQKLSEFNINIKGKYSGENAIFNTKTKETIISIKLPSNENAGSSVTLLLKKIEN